MMVAACHTNQPPTGSFQQSDDRPAIHVYLYTLSTGLASPTRTPPPGCAARRNTRRFSAATPPPASRTHPRPDATPEYAAGATAHKTTTATPRNRAATGGYRQTARALSPDRRSPPPPV